MQDPTPNRIRELPQAFDRLLSDELARGVRRGRAAAQAFARLAETPLVDWQPRYETDGVVQVELNPYPDVASVQCTWRLPRYDAHGEWQTYTNFNLVMSFQPAQARFDADELVEFGEHFEHPVTEMPAWLATRVDLRSAPQPKIDVFLDGGMIDD